jgi:energy-coupling factor transport system substrate-specific component
VALGAFVRLVKLPLFLDSLGTVLVSVLGGPLPGILTGLISVAISGMLTDPVAPWFGGTMAIIGAWSGWCAARGAFRRLWLWCLCGALLGVITAIVSAPVKVFLFGGITPAGNTFIVALLMASGKSAWESVVLTGIGCDPVDKALTFLLAWVLIQGLPRTALAHFPGWAALARTEQRHGKA